MMWGYGDNYMMHGGYWGFGWIFTLIFWVIIIMAIVWAVKHLVAGGGPHGLHMSGEDPAMQILKERYAKGEIGKEEFEAKKKDLMGK